ncbi:membrane dipeptidase [Mesorhizobium sp. M1329]|uniref:membrane dipeptidase n=1 Tax=Mesorhizobium sp. M1329 TaxID=2957083 RepID=UPI0033395C42
MADTTDDRHVCFDALQYSNWFGVAETDAISYHPDRDLIEQWRRGKVDAVHVTVTLWSDARATMNSVMRWHRLFREHSGLVLHATSAADIDLARKSDRTAVFLGFQNTSPFEDDLAMIEAFHRLGVRCAQLTYNIQNYVGSSCYEPVDTGLSRFGRLVLREMNRVGMLIDVSHCGHRTTLDAVEHSKAPIALTHANPLSFVKHPRAKSDEVIKAVTGRGGVIGVNAYAPLLGGTHVTLQDWAGMVARLVDMVGIAHVAIGTDTSLRWQDADLLSMNVARWSHEANWGSNIGNKQGWSEPLSWYQTSEHFPTLVAGLEKHGFGASDVAAIVGGNWKRLFGEVIG